MNEWNEGDKWKILSKGPLSKVLNAKKKFMLLPFKFYFLIIFTDINQIFQIFAQKPIPGDIKCVYITTLVRAGLAQSVERSARNHKRPSSKPVLANSAYE